LEPVACPLVDLPCNEWKEQRQWKKIRGSLRTRASRSVRAILARAIPVRATPVRATPVSVRVRIIPVKAVGPVRTTLDKAIPARADSVPVRTLPDKGSPARAVAG
jgi:predicted oxidoreductase